MADLLLESTANIQGSVAMELQQIPAFSSSTPAHGPKVVVQRASVAIGSRFDMGHHPLQRDLFGTPSQTNAEPNLQLLGKDWTVAKDSEPASKDQAYHP